MNTASPQTAPPPTPVVSTANPAPITAPVTPPNPSTPTPSAAPDPVRLGTDPAPVTPSVSSTWPSEWRKEIGGDGDKTLERFASPKDLYSSYQAMRQRLSSGELKPSLPKDATPEQLAEYRQSLGVPDTWEKYELKLDQGIQVNEQDKPFLDLALKELHGLNATPDLVNKAVNLSYQIEQRRNEARREADLNTQSVTEESLRKEWGVDYARNINSFNGMIDGMPKDLQDLFIQARLGDGTPLILHADAVRHFANLGRELNPIPTLVNGTGLDSVATVNDKIGEIETLMKTKPNEYWGNEKKQTEYRELLGFRERYKDKK